MTEEDRFERAIEKLIADQSPREDALKLRDEDRDMLRMAQLIRGTARAAPSDEFVEDLHHRLFPKARRVSRRAAFFGGLSAMAAGILGGFGIDRAVNSSGSSQQAFNTRWKFDIVREGKGRWFPVAKASELTPGSVRPFTAGAVQGFLINEGGQIRAMSRICTHMGCALSFEQNKQRFLCPCHGAEFSMHGQMVEYPIPLKDLPKIYTRQKGDVIEAYGV